MRLAVSGIEDPVWANLEDETSLELHLRDAFSIDERSVLALVRKKVLIPHSEKCARGIC